MQKLKRGEERIAVYETVLYLDDFLALVQLFEEHCNSVTVTVEDFRLDDPGSAILQMKDRLRRSVAFEPRIKGHLDPVDQDYIKTC
jgi:hypothetical protein